MKKSKKEVINKTQKVKVAATRLTRAESVVRAIQQLKTGTKTEILEKSDQLFTKAGGKSNLSEANWLGGSYVLPALVAIGAVVVDDKGLYKIK
jgi:hypothetical protein